MSGIKKSIMYQGIYEILILILPLVTSPYISRILGAEKIGIHSYTYSISNYFVLIAMLGIKNYGNRMVAKVRDNQKELNKTFSNIFYMHIIVSTLSIILYFIYFSFSAEEYRLYTLIQSMYVIGALFDINWFYFGIEKFKLTVVRNGIIKIATACSIFLFIKTPEDLWKYITIMGLGTLISNLAVWLVIKRYVSFEKPDLQNIIQHFKPMIILFIPAIAVSLYTIMDKIMLGNLSTKIQVGFYENSEKIISMPMGIIGAFGTVMLSRTANIIGDNMNISEKYLLISMKYIMFIAFAIAFGIAGISDKFAVILWGNGFEECGRLISYLSIMIPFIAFANVIKTQYLIPHCKDKTFILSVFVGAGINILINLMLIPSLHAMGAVIGTIFAEICVCIVQAIAVYKKIDILVYIKNSLFFLVQGIIMYILIRYIGSKNEITVFSLLLQVLVGGIFYLFGSSIYFILKKDETFLEIFKKFK